VRTRGVAPRIGLGTGDAEQAETRGQPSRAAPSGSFSILTPFIDPSSTAYICAVMQAYWVLMIRLH
jgi:hypothetical protein